MLAENLALWREEDRRIGRAEGRTEGRAEGLAEGLTKGRAEILKIVYQQHKKLDMTDNQIIDILCRIYGLSETEAKNIILKSAQ